MSPWQAKLNRYLFDLADPIGRKIHLVLMALIIGSVLLGMAGTTQALLPWRPLLSALELLITGLFVIEYLLRLYAARHPRSYALSIYGVIDLAAILPLFLFGDTNTSIRLLRVFRMLKLIRYLKALHLFVASLRDVYEIMLVVASTIAIIVLLAGNLIVLVEPSLVDNAFEGCWWALVTMTTVGYGDIVPHTAAGQLLASGLMILGVAMFAMLTGTISVKIAHIVTHSKRCHRCRREIAQEFAFCPFCGEPQADH